MLDFINQQIEIVRSVLNKALENNLNNQITYSLSVAMDNLINEWYAINK